MVDDGVVGPKGLLDLIEQLPFAAHGCPPHGFARHLLRHMPPQKPWSERQEQLTGTIAVPPSSSAGALRSNRSHLEPVVENLRLRLLLEVRAVKLQGK